MTAEADAAYPKSSRPEAKRIAIRRMSSIISGKKYSGLLKELSITFLGLVRIAQAAEMLLITTTARPSKRLLFRAGLEPRGSKAFKNSSGSGAAFVPYVFSKHRL